MNAQKGTSIILVSILATLASIIGFLSHQYPKEYAQYINNTGQRFGSGGQAVQSITVNTSSPLAGGGSVALGGSLTLTCSTCSAFAYPFTVISASLNSTSTQLQLASTTVMGSFNTGAITSTSSITTNTLLVNASSTHAGNFTINGSATSTQDFTVLGKFANKQGSSTVNMTGVTLIDFNALGTRQKWMMSGATQLVLNATSSNPLAGMTFLIDICNGSGSVLTFVTPQALRWDGTNGTTTFTSTANQHQMFWGYYDGVTSMNHIVGSSTPTICL